MDKSKHSSFISTAIVPPQFLEAAFLVGKIPFQTLSTNHRVSYTLYIPSKHYNPDPSRRSAISSSPDEPSVYQLPQLPLIVNVHGTGRNAERCRNSLIDFANKHRVAILAPLFPASNQPFSGLHNYKLRGAGGIRSDKALLEILDEVKQRWPGINTEKVVLMGSSGGAQFTQRFLYLHPERLGAASISAPGTVTRLDGTLDWPSGVKNMSKLFDGIEINLNSVRKVRIQLVVGSLDSKPHGAPEFWDWMQEMKKGQFAKSRSDESQTSTGPRIDRVENRLETLKQLKTHWEEQGIQSELVIVDDAGHDYEAKLPTVIKFLEDVLEDTIS